MVVNCTSAGLPAAGYPSKAQGKLISGKYARATSVEIQRNGAPANARGTLRFDNLCTTSANTPTIAPHTEAIMRSTPQPAAMGMPPCTARVSAIHGTQVRQKTSPCRNPQANAIQPREPKMQASKIARHTQEYELEKLPR